MVTPTKLHWPSIVQRAATIVRSYDTGVTLRQLFYRLVAAEVLPNTTNAYKALSRTTAEARRRGLFPDLVDRTRNIHRYQTFPSADYARQWLGRIYRRDRTEEQEYSVYLGVEKNGLVAQIQSWFGDFGVPILALGGYASQSYVDEVAADVGRQGRPAVLIYAGDFDPSGEDIQRDFQERTACFHQVDRIALNQRQVEDYDLPPQMGKATDARASAFVAKYGELVQVELDALPPDVLRSLYETTFNAYWDHGAYEAICDRERDERAGLVGASQA